MKENVEELVKEKLGQGAVFPAGEENTAFSQYFKGQSYLKMLTTAGVGIGNVTFEPGCRNNWHIHHKGGQILLVTGGRGWYQEWGKEAVELHAGDVVNIPPEVKHWHGAAKDSWSWRCRPTALPMSGWRLWRMRNTAGFHRNLLQNRVKI